MFAEAKHSFKKHGIRVEGVEVDVAAMQQQKVAAVDGLTKGVEGLFKKNKVCPLQWALAATLEKRTCENDGTVDATVRAKHWHAAVQVEYVQGWAKLRSPTEVEVTTPGGTS